MRRLAPWIYSGALVVIGVAFLIAAQAQSGAADRYRNARNCPDTTSPDCYQLSSGTILSVGVSQTRSGERDTTVIDTGDTSVTVVLEPASSDASHIRTGAAVTVKWYQGKVTLVEVDGLNVPSIDNPSAQQSDYQFYGILLVALGGLSVLVPFWLRRRRARQASSLAAGGGASAGAIEPSLLPEGELGWVVRPALKARAMAALGLGGLFLAFTTLRIDPSRTSAAIAFDAVVVGLGVLALALYLRNSKVIANKQRITRVDWLGRSVTSSISDVLHVDQFSTAQNPYLIFAGRDGRQLFRVSGIYWDYDRLLQVCHELGLTLVGGFDEVVRPSSVNKRAKAKSNWGATALAIGGLTVGIVVFVVLLVGPTSR